MPPRTARPAAPKAPRGKTARPAPKKKTPAPRAAAPALPLPPALDPRTAELLQGIGFHQVAVSDARARRDVARSDVDRGNAEKRIAYHEIALTQLSFYLEEGGDAVRMLAQDNERLRAEARELKAAAEERARLRAELAEEAELSSRRAALIGSLAEALSEEDPRCATCGQPATCFGSYEAEKARAFSCDACCGHAGEDGHCDPLGLAAMRRARDSAERGSRELGARLYAYRHRLTPADRAALNQISSRAGADRERPEAGEQAQIHRDRAVLLDIIARLTAEEPRPVDDPAPARRDHVFGPEGCTRCGARASLALNTPCPKAEATEEAPHA